jgi:hypothetical protein
VFIEPIPPLNLPVAGSKISALERAPAESSLLPPATRTLPSGRGAATAP